MTEEQLGGLSQELEAFLAPHRFCCDYTQTFGRALVFRRALVLQLR